MNRFETTFGRLAAANRKALVAYFTAGDPGFDASFAILDAACRAGVDVLELGVPFSDATSDGPVIQAAARRALDAGMTLEHVLHLAARLRAAHPRTPLVLFSYYNPLLAFGAARLGPALTAAGIDHHVGRVGPLVGLHLAAGEPHDYDDARRTDTDLYAALFHAVLDRGVALAPGPYEITFPGLAHDDAVIDTIVERVADAARHVAP